ncbi:PolC-type DNA polymerase III [Candidatus Stoquefichus massiliensis]|uniref:3'-5' exonuclease n=1 Tax=Candidatus Stoquefichus massiliensis TaxID=1470350 RepID=UPI000484D9E2|nr:3'-5' exonuclease [Candidatus Stoquefichus massiliensis]
METYYRKAKSRGKYVKKIVDDYSVLDLETTGLSWQRDQIIEIGIIKVRNQKIVDKYEQLLDPQREISHFITQLTGIDNNMVFGMPTLYDIMDEVIRFIDDDIIIGHNTAFDLSFIANHFGWNIENEYMDTLQFSRKVYPQMKHHRLTDMVEFLNLTNNEHRSLADCRATYELYEHLKSIIIQNQIKL